MFNADIASVVAIYLDNIHEMIMDSLSDGGNCVTLHPDDIWFSNDREYDWTMDILVRKGYKVYKQGEDTIISWK